jgi:hypothetical protein
MPRVRENKTMRKQNQQDALEIGLIRSLFEARGPAVIMTTCFLLGGDLAAWQTCDPDPRPAAHRRRGDLCRVDRG